MGDNLCSDSGLKASGWTGEEVGKLNASCTDETVVLEFLLFFCGDELKRLRNQLIGKKINFGCYDEQHNSGLWAASRRAMKVEPSQRKDGRCY